MDEINRASPRTQSALLEAMGEGMVTMDRVSYRLEKPFMVMATQNPIEHEGTFRLPEAQMDRFLLRLSLGYPDADQERQMCLRAQLQHPIESLTPITTGDLILKCQKGVREIQVPPAVCDYLITLTRATREHPRPAAGRQSARFAGFVPYVPGRGRDPGQQHGDHRTHQSHCCTGAGPSPARPS